MPNIDNFLWVSYKKCQCLDSFSEYTSKSPNDVLTNSPKTSVLKPIQKYLIYIKPTSNGNFENSVQIMASILKKMSCKTVCLDCIKPSIVLPGSAKVKKLASESQMDVSRQQVSLQRLSLSDFSNPSSPISLHDLSSSLVGSNLYFFTLQELQVVTNNFSRDEFLGRGGFGKVYKGFIDDGLKPGFKAQPVAVKVLDLNGCQGHEEWLVSLYIYIYIYSSLYIDFLIRCRRLN